MMREVPFGNDGDFSRVSMIGRINNDLANDFGNLAQRVLSFVARHGEGRVPDPGPLEPADFALLEQADSLLETLRVEYDNQAFNRALERVWEVVGAANRYVDEQAPWQLRRTDPARMATVLYTLMETVRHLAILMQPVVPGSAGRMLDQLGIAADARDFSSIGADHRLVAGTPLPAPSPVFPRFRTDG